MNYQDIKFINDALTDSAVSAHLSILKLSDEEAYNHSLSVAELTAMCLEEMIKLDECEYTNEECLEIVKGALLHDIGKSFLPFGLQHSSEKLTPEMHEVIKMHPLLGFIALEGSNVSDIVKNIVLLHHENLLGTGYPINTKTGQNYLEEEIPSYVWIVSYADRFTAMTGSRKFKRSLSYGEAFDEINKLRIEGIIPYKYATYFHEVIVRINIFNNVS